MIAAPFRDSTPSLLKRIEDLERANLRLRMRSRRSFTSDIGALLRAICRLVATMLCVVGLTILAFIVVGFIVALVAGIASIA